MIKVRLDTPETEDWIKPPIEHAKNAARKRIRSGDDHGPGSPPPRGRRLKKHADHNQEDHGNWARRGHILPLLEARSLASGVSLSSQEGEEQILQVVREEGSSKTVFRGSRRKGLKVGDNVTWNRPLLSTADRRHIGAGFTSKEGEHKTLIGFKDAHALDISDVVAENSQWEREHLIEGGTWKLVEETMEPNENYPNVMYRVLWAERVKSIVKHHGPGPHKSGSSQSVHGGTTGGAKTPAKGRKIVPLGGKHEKFHKDDYYRFELDGQIYAMDAFVGKRDGTISVREWKTKGKLVGRLDWSMGHWRDDKGRISDVGVVRRLRRRGIATAMLDMARDLVPEVHHSTDLSETGKAWAEVIKHHGPGPHKSGSSQDVHGSGGGGIQSPAFIGDSNLTPHPSSPRGMAQSPTRQLIDRGKELRPEFDRLMQVADGKAKVLEASRDERRLEMDRLGDWARIASGNARDVERRLRYQLEKHYPSANRDVVRKTLQAVDGDMAKFHEVMQGGIQVEDVASTIKITDKQRSYLIDQDYSWETSAKAGVRIEGNTVIIPDTAAGDRFLGDVKHLYYMAHDSERRVFGNLLKKVTAVGAYEERRQKLPGGHEYVDPTVWFKDIDLNRAILSGDTVHQKFWDTGEIEVSKYVDGEYTKVMTPDRGVYNVTASDDAPIVGVAMADGEVRMLMHAEFDVGLRYGGPDVADPKPWVEMPLSELSQSMESEYAFWGGEATTFTSSRDQLFEMQQATYAETKEVYADAFKEWLGGHREIGQQVDVKRRTKAARGVMAASEFYPDDWVQASNDRGKLSIEQRKQRGHYAENKHGEWDLSSGEGRIVTDGSSNTNIHELGHRMEHSYEPLSTAESGFYGMRTNGEASAKLQDLRPGYRYRSHEVTYPDDFADPYMGKSYNSGAYELISMAMPRLTQGLSNKRSKVPETPYGMDEEMLHWVLGVLVDV